MREKMNKPLRMSEEEERDFKNSTKCHICERKYKREEMIVTKYDPENLVNFRVRDHCHITGKYRGSAHNSCNLKFSLSLENLKIPVIFHNLQGYDSHFIMQKLGKIIEEVSIYDVHFIKAGFH